VCNLESYLQSPFINKNDYGIVLEDFPFSLSPPKNSRFRSTSPSDRPGLTNFGQLEIFHDDISEAELESQSGNKEQGAESQEEVKAARLKRSEIISDSGAYCR